MSNLPRHIAIAMDGNGRWANKKNLPRLAGHMAGAQAIKEIVKVCGSHGIEALTLFAFSRENWGRPSDEVNALLALFFDMLESETEHLNQDNVQLRIIGELAGFPAELQAVIKKSQQLTAHNTGLKLSIAVNYSGRWDITQAVSKLAVKVETQQLKAKDIIEALIQQHLCLADLPEPDLFIRTSGEKRISNFFLWQLAYTEFYFTDLFWPDFNVQALLDAFAFFESRQRRYGLLNEQMPVSTLEDEAINGLSPNAPYLEKAVGNS